MTMLSDEELAENFDYLTAYTGEDSDGTASGAVNFLRAHIDALTAQRDRARDLVVALTSEQQYEAPDLAGLTADELHAVFAHPAYEYATTTSPRKSGISVEPEGDGWEPNCIVDRGGDADGKPYPRRNWERFEYHEEEFWRRRKPDGEVPSTDRLPIEERTLDALLGFQVEA